MANTSIGFTINIEGLSTIEQLNEEIKKTNQELKEAEVGSKKYAATAERLAKLKAEQKALRKNQTELTKSFLETSDALGAYDKASAKLNRLRKEFKNLAIEGKATSKRGKELTAEIQRLDKQLKETDKTVGQFQRNVGNYPRVFGQSTKAIFKQIPALDKLNQRLEKTTGVSNILGKALVGGFIAFKAAGVLVDLFQQFDELIKKVDEVRNSVAVLAGVGGEDLDKLTASVTALSTTFGVDAEQINKSAKALSKELGVSFEEALGKIESGLLSGVASNEEFLSSIEEAPAAFREVEGSLDGYSSRQKELLEANKALAEAQIELTNEFAGSAGGLKTFATQAQTFLIKTLLGIIEIFRPVVDAFKDLGSSLFSLFEGFKVFKGEAGATKGILELLLAPLKRFAGFLTTVANAIRLATDFLKDLVDSSPALQKFIQFNIKAFKQLTGFFADLPNLFAGVIEATKQLGKNFKAFFEVTFLDAQIFAAKVKGLFVGGVQKEIEALRKRRKAITDEGRSIFEAFEEGRKAAQKAGAERAAKRREEQAKANLEAQKRAVEEEEAEKRRIKLKEQKKTADALAKQRAKERQKFLAEEEKFLLTQAAIIGKLREKQEKLILAGITDVEEQARAKAKAASEARVAQAEADFNKLVELTQAREAEALKLFGADSEEFKKVQAQNVEAIAKGEEELSGIRTRERIALTNELLDIDKKFLQKREQAGAASLAKEISNLKQKEELATSKLEERLAEGKIKEEEFSAALFNIQKERIKKELELIQQREKQIANSSTEAAKEENQKLLLQKQNLYTQLAKLDKDLTEEQKKNREDLAKKDEEEDNRRLARIKETAKLASEVFLTGLNTISEFQAIADQKRAEAIAKEEEQNQLRTQQLQERLNTATGLEAEFLNQEIRANEAAAETIARKKEEIEKEQAKRSKARAIIESIIQTALAVVEAAPNIPLQIIAGVTGAAATATIAAQPLATGGVVGSLGSDIVKFSNGGKVTSKGNIKPLSNGDNVLATLKTGEVVLTKEQQAKIGGFSVLKAAGVPNFAEGGLVGSPTSLIQKTTTIEADSKAILTRLEQGIASTNERIDRIQVLWTSETQAEQDKGLNDREQIKTNATF